MKKILFVIYGMNTKGGSERVVAELSAELAEHHQVEILCREIGIVAYPLDNRVKITRINQSGIGLLLAFKSYIDSHDYDVVVVHPMTKLMASLLLVGLKHERLISVEHTSYVNASSHFRVLKRLLYHRIKQVLVLTHKDQEFYSRFHPHVEVIRNPSPFEIHHHYDSDSKKIVSVGSLIKGKGFDRMIEAWKDIEAQSRGFSLHIYGTGPEMPTLQGLIKYHNLKRVFLMGQKEDIRSVYASAAFFMMSSHFEGLPMVLIEAQSMGLPIVAYDCPFGPAEIITDGQDGYLVQNSNQAEFVSKTLALINSPSLRRFFSRNALSSAKRFDKKMIVQQWLDRLEKL